MSQIVLYFLHSTLVLSFYIDVVLTLSIHGMSFKATQIRVAHLPGANELTHGTAMINIASSLSFPLPKWQPHCKR